MAVTVTLYSASGAAFQALPITIAMGSFRRINLAPLAEQAGVSFLEGSLSLSYVGRFLEIGAQITYGNPESSTLFDEQLAEPSTMFRSSALAGTWFLPSTLSSLRFQVANTTVANKSVTIVAKLSTGYTTTTSLNLAGHEMRSLDVRLDLLNGTGLTEAGSLRLTHSGISGDVIARGSVTNLAMGYSGCVDFIDPANSQTSTFHGAGLRIASVAGEQLKTAVVIHNSSSQSSTITFRVPFSLDSGYQGTFVSNPQLLSSGEVRLLFSGPLLTNAQREHVVSAGIEIVYSTAPGSVVASVQSFSTSGFHSFRVPLLDRNAQASSSGGYPWMAASSGSIDDLDTIVYVKNVSAVAQLLYLELRFNGGGWSTGDKTVAAGQTVAFNLQALRDTSTQDAYGETILPTALKGQAHWSIVGPAAIAFVGRAEYVDRIRGRSASYACLNACPDSSDDGRIEPASPDIGVGQTKHLHVEEVRRNLYLLPFTSTRPLTSGVSWEAVIPGTDISSPCLHIDPETGDITGLAMGIATVRARWHGIVYNEIGCPPSPEKTQAPGAECCTAFIIEFMDETTVTVAAPGVDIKLNNEPITNTQVDVVVGQRLDLSVSERSLPPGTRSFEWQLPEGSIKKWAVSADSSEATIVPVKITNPDLRFYVTRGTRDGSVVSISVKITIGQSAPITAQAQLRILSPDATLSTRTGSTSLAPTGTRLIFYDYDEIDDGIVFSKIIRRPIGYSGESQWVQVVNQTSRSTRRGTVCKGVNQLDVNLLDGTYPYQIRDDGNADDSPSQSFTSSDDEVKVHDRFTMWLMWKSSMSDAEWVPLSSVAWYWKGTVRRNTNGAFELVLADNSQNPAGVQTFTYPKWNGLVQGLTDGELPCE